MKPSLTIPYSPDHFYTLLKYRDRVNYSVKSSVMGRFHSPDDDSLLAVPYSTFGACRPDRIDGISSDRPCKVLDGSGKVLGNCKGVLYFETPIHLHGTVWPEVFVRYETGLEEDEVARVDVLCSVDRENRYIMNETFDIISLDNYIKQGFANEERKIDEYRARLAYLEDYIARDDTSDRIRTVMKDEIRVITDRLKDIENNCINGFYILETNECIEKYREILTKPLRMSFMGRKESESKEKKEIVQRYLAIADKYTDIREYCKQQGLTKLVDDSDKIRIVCKNCTNKRSFEIIDGKTFVCDDCGFQEEFLNNLSSFKDVNRVNISSKYTYERRVHFRDCINQYQAKQNSTVTPKVLQDIEEQLRNHGLENSDGKTTEERWAKVTKDHILLFLKETGHTKHYEDVFLIFNKITAKKIDDISHLEPKLLDDFDKLSTLYDKKFKQDKDKKIVRKSFINTQYVLYQLLRRHRHPCRKEDFNILKTLDRKSWHDEICKELFEELGWNFFPSF